MRFTPVADMIEAMFDNGADLKSVLLAVRTIEKRDAERHAERHAERLVTLTERSAGAIRSARHRAKVKQNQAEAGANDAANADDESLTGGRHAERHGVTPTCNLSSLLPLSKRGNREESKKDSKKESKKDTARANAKPSRGTSRGTRLDRESLLLADDRKFAIDNGLPAARVEARWAEFIDYWVGVPGSRGTKLDWSATWRNRVRAISSKQGAGSGNGISNNRADSSVRPAQTHGDAILAGMARHAARVSQRQIAERRANGDVQANPDSSDADSTNSKTAPNDRGQYPLLTVVAGSNPRE